MELLLLGSSLAVLQPGRLRICNSRETSWDCSYWALEYACMLQFVAVYYACGASRSCCNSKASIVMQLGHSVGEGESCRVCCALHCTLYNLIEFTKQAHMLCGCCFCTGPPQSLVSHQSSAIALLAVMSSSGCCCCSQCDHRKRVAQYGISCTLHASIHKATSLAPFHLHATLAAPRLGMAPFHSHCEHHPVR